jgi:hypothetical protein
MRAIAIYMVVTAHVIVTTTWTVDLSMYEVPIRDGSFASAYCSNKHCTNMLQHGEYMFNMMTAKFHAMFRVLLQFGMPAFMYCSGRSLAFSRDDFATFAYKKVQRLLGPLLVGYFLVVVPTEYISCEWQPGTIKESCNMSFFSYYIWHVSNFRDGFSWLWFLPALLILALLNYPFSAWYSLRYRENLKSWLSDHDSHYLPMIAGVACIAIAVPCLALGTSIWYGAIVALPYMINALLLYSINFIRDNQRMELMVSVAQVAPSLALAVIHNHELGDDTAKRIIAASCFFNFFYLQGFVDQVLEAEYLLFEKTSTQKKWRPISMFLMMMILAVSNPGTDFEVGYLWSFPIYRSWLETLTYVAGSWVWMTVFVRLGQAFYQDYLEESQSIYKHITASSMVVYVVHWFFVNVLVAVFTRPCRIGLAGTLVVLLTGGITLSWAFYFLLSRVPRFGLCFGSAMDCNKAKNSSG